MNTMPVKQHYYSPEIQRIDLDNEITLILVSGNPGDPFAKSEIKIPDYFNKTPFDSNLS